MQTITESKIEFKNYIGKKKHNYTTIAIQYKSDFHVHYFYYFTFTMIIFKMSDLKTIIFKLIIRLKLFQSQQFTIEYFYGTKRKVKERKKERNRGGGGLLYIP